MIVHEITHPQAVEAIEMARALYGAPSGVITRRVTASGCPRALFILASILQAATRPGAIIERRVNP